MEDANPVGGKSFLRVMSRVGKILEREQNFNDRFIEDYSELHDIVKVLKAMGKTIVMTGGVYDLLHTGHLRYLAEAKRRGDILIVSVDTDEITRKRKGKNRPVVEQDERVETLLHSRYVDIITLRNVPPGQNDDIEAVVPHVLITSETTKDFPEVAKQKFAQIGVEVVVLEQQAPSTTTGRIRKLMIDGVEGLVSDIDKVVRDYLNKIQRGGS